MSAADTANPLGRPNDRLRRRKRVNRGMEVISMLSAALAVFLLGVLIYKIAREGAGQISWNFFTKGEVPFAGPGVPQGLANAFAGSLVIVGLAAAMALPVGILIAIYVTEFAPRKVRNFVSLILDVLQGVPAVVIGVFAFGLLVLHFGQKGIFGSIALAILAIPLISRSTIEVLLLVPNSLREAALGLGVPRWRTTLGIVLPQTVGGIVTGAVLAVSRIAGEAAPLLFVSYLAGNNVSWNPWQAQGSVPLAIFGLSESPDPQDHARAWAAALVLTVFILCTSLGARWLATRNRRKLARTAR